MIIDDLPDAPDPAIDPPKVFSSKAAAMVLAFKNMVVQIRAAIANINSIAAGGAYAIPYRFVANVTNAGDLSVDNPAAQSSTATLRVSTTSSAGVTVGSTIATFGGSSSAAKGVIKLTKFGDPSKWLRLAVTSVSLNGNYYAMAVTLVDSSGANPFTVGDSVNLDFSRTGDKGDIGSGAHVLLAQASVTSAVANIDFLNVFSAAYDKYVIEIQGAKPSATATLGMRMANSGTVDSTSPYYQWTADGAATTTANAFNLPVSTNAGVEGSFTIEVRNANSTLAKAVGVRGFHNGTSPGGAVSREGAYVGAVVSGFRLYWSSGNFTAGTVRVYGIKNT